MKIDTQSETWLAIKKHCDQQIERLRDALERDAPDNWHYAARGEIKALRSLLALADPQPLKQPIDAIPFAVPDIGH